MQTVATLASTTILANEASVTFSSIPQQYSDLILIAECAHATANNNLILRFNGDSGNNYNYAYLMGNGSTVSTGREFNTNTGFVGGVPTSRAFNKIDIYAYSSSSKLKMMMAQSGGAGWNATVWATLWNSTSPITSVQFLPQSGNFLAGSKFTLTGVI